LKEKEEKAIIFLQTTDKGETVKGDDLITSGGITNRKFSCRQQVKGRKSIDAL
jgi:hypothetical protein